MSVTFICGHLHPDTDSIVSALAFEELLINEGNSVLAVRGGPLNPETKWVLKRFNTQVPPEIRDVRVQLRDLSYDKVEPINKNALLWEAWEHMNDTGINSLPVGDDNNKLCGVITIGDLGSLVYDTDLSKMRSIDGSRLVKTLNGLVSGNLPQEMHAQIAWSGRANHHIDTGAVVFAEFMTEEQIVKAIKAKALGFCLCYVSDEEGELVRRKWEERFREADMFLLTTPLDPFTAIRRAMLCASVNSVLQHEKIYCFHEDDVLDEVRPVMLKSRYRAYPVLDKENRVLGMVSRYHLLQPSRKKVILVDHNERSQAVRGIDQAEIMGIIDHHRLGDISTNQPILFRNETVGCTATILTKMFKERGFKPTKRTAGLMCCAILSDTVQFKSPTCTNEDIQACQYLAEIAGEDLDALGKEMFSMDKHIFAKNTHDLLFMDFKEFNLGEIKVGIGQLSLSSFEGMEKLLDDMCAEMERTRPLQRFDLLLFMATDIGKEGTHLYYSGSHIKDLSDAFNLDLDPKKSFGVCFLPGVMSRKKQLIPALDMSFR